MGEQVRDKPQPQSTETSHDNILLPQILLNIIHDDYVYRRSIAVTISFKLQLHTHNIAFSFEAKVQTSQPAWCLSLISDQETFAYLWLNRKVAIQATSLAFEFAFTRNRCNLKCPSTSLFMINEQCQPLCRAWRPVLLLLSLSSPTTSDRRPTNHALWFFG